MRRFTLAVALVMTGLFGGCSRETNDPLGILAPAGDLSGVWTGTAPNGAVFHADVGNPNCIYEADLDLQLAQTGSKLSGLLRMTIRDFTGPLTNPWIPCTAVGTQSTQQLTGSYNGTRINFTLEDGATAFTGTCTPDLISGELVVDSVTSVRGTWSVTR
jgi:hypothetical protein